MPTNAFIGKTTAPTAAELAAALGPAAGAWRGLLEHLARDHAPVSREWKCFSPKWGWSLRVLRRKRTILWLSPARDVFTVLFILGDRAVRATRRAGLPVIIARRLAAAPRYPEGTGLRLDVRSPRSLPALRRLAAIKLAG